MARLNQPMKPRIDAEGFSMDGLPCIEKRVRSIFQKMGHAVMDRPLDFLENNPEFLPPLDAMQAEWEFP